MIEVSVRQNSLTVSGHAEYADQGHDIVCAAVSALTYTLIHSLGSLANEKIGYLIRDGDIEITYKELSKQGKLLIDSFFIGIVDIINEYPEYVKLAP